MPNKALTIDVNPAAIPSGLVDNWSPLGNTTVFINNIQTPKLSEKNKRRTAGVWYSDCICE